MGRAGLNEKDNNSCDPTIKSSKQSFITGINIITKLNNAVIFPI